MEQKIKTKKSKFILFGKIILSIFVSFFNATMSIVWGMAGLFLLLGLLVYFKIDTSHITQLLLMARYIMENWFYFWLAFLILNVYEKNK